MVMPPGTAGTYLIHFTGSKEHNVRLRGRARDRGWSLSEKGFLRIGPDGSPLPGAVGAPPELRTFPTEEEAYAFLELPWIPPELREEVFKPFLRLDDARNQDEGGTGLGLAIARDIARSHGGDIMLGDSPLGGLRATVRIPV